ncbi:MAG: chemotaxis protein CheW [Rhodocyclaceae bacterium]|nr:chemotaxis protein CheW [Rhodocyclaceae bacterium]
MAIDMSQFYQVFFEEAAEHLSDMESLLVEVDIGTPDPEEMNAIFRAAHSIKGSSGTFGFNDMTEVTHVMETLLDMVRKEEAELTTDIVDACLDAGDVLRNLLAAHRGEGEADREAAADVSQRLEALCQEAGRSSAGGAPAVEPVRTNETQAAASGGSHYTIEFLPTDAAGRDAEVMENLHQELSAMGRLEVLEAGEGGQCRLRLETSTDRDQIVALIEFLAQDGSLAVTAEGAGDADATDEAYGFFGDEPSEPAAEDRATQGGDEAYGFFESAEENAPASESGGDADGAYGFFDPPQVASDASPAIVQDDADGKYGFFGAVEAPAADTPPANVTSIQSGAAAEASAPKAERAREKAPAKSGAKGGDSSIRVSVEKVDQMINLVGELVITQAMLQQSASDLDPVVFERLMAGLGQLERNTRDLQESVMSIRMMPISVVFSRFPRVVRDVSRKLDKKVELKLSGESTELDKGLIERITDPLTHLIRNSLDHGIESPERRRAAGKPETGTITLNASHQSGYIIIEVGDDGAGLNRDKILSKAKERGLNVTDTMSDADVWQLIFEPGFSTADKVTDVSGRGVGMDVVKRNITDMGGSVEIESMTGVGTRMTVRLPLTLAILDGMSVAVGNETYVLPLNYIIESLQPETAQIRTLSEYGHVIQVRGEFLPVICMHEVFGIPGAQTDYMKGLMIVVEAGGNKVALFIDALLGQHQVVIKSLDTNFRRIQGISGATIMGDGQVALIIDVAGVIALSRGPAAMAA